MMIRIAVVGEIGSGKTFVSNLFGFPVFSADDEVAKIYKKNRIVYRKLRLKLPKFVSSFPVNKKNIITAIKYNPKNLKTISNIIHPVVRKQMRIFLKKNYKRKAIVLDIPLYFENNLNEKNDIVIFVSAKKKLINEALKKRKKSNKFENAISSRSSFILTISLTSCNLSIFQNFINYI